MELCLMQRMDSLGEWMANRLHFRCSLGSRSKGLEGDTGYMLSNREYTPTMPFGSRALGVWLDFCAVTSWKAKGHPDLGCGMMVCKFLGSETHRFAHTLTFVATKLKVGAKFSWSCPLDLTYIVTLWPSWNSQDRIQWKSFPWSQPPGKWTTSWYITGWLKVLSRDTRVKLLTKNTGLRKPKRRWLEKLSSRNWRLTMSLRINCLTTQLTDLKMHFLFRFL